MRLSGSAKTFQDEMQKHRSNVWIEFVNYAKEIRIHFRDRKLKRCRETVRSDVMDSDPVGLAEYVIKIIEEHEESHESEND